MIQLATLGLTPVVVEEGLKKSLPEKLYIIHTKKESNYDFEKEAKKLKKKIEEQYKIPTILEKVDAFDMDKIIHSLLNIIYKEKKANANLSKKDFAINITGGTKLMVSAATVAAYLAGTRVYYVMEASKHRGEELVKELPMPVIPEKDDKGNTSKITKIVLEKIKKLGKCTYSMLLEEVRKDTRVKKNQRIEYHLAKLQTNDLITVTRGWEKPSKNKMTGKSLVDNKKNTIQLTPSGEYYAEFSDLLGSIL
ncbi:hypothetical protein NsoK4_08120 [Nitrosopumilus sp. K4]|uniref:HFX_2341 family transcriptional regulator domain-containing protein n=1 Tax=Nitrosopumilus sp. K4 TaxID=2795383 RepID=UPI001BAD9E41|nr:DUF6293 family protein [Nitrosopumilus sp. K4]QUC64381.1 hypothetical protein NsoK4_08120 [Nitrosopumilus sp. K4]